MNFNIKRKKLFKVLIALVLTIVMGLLLVTGWFLGRERFWQGIGRKLVAEVNDRIDGELTVDKISGNLVTGMVFEQVRLTRPTDGEIVRASRLEISLSLFSLLKLQPVIGLIKLSEPQMILSQDPKGRWNVEGLKKKRPPPPFTTVQLPAIQIQGGNLQINRPGQETIIKGVDIDLDITIQQIGRPNQVVLVNQGTIAGDLPQLPRLSLDLQMTSTPEQLTIQEFRLNAALQPLVSLQGVINELGKTPKLDVYVELKSLTGEQLHSLWEKWPLPLAASGKWQITGDLSHLDLTGKAKIGDGQVEMNGSVRQESPPTVTYALQVDFTKLGLVPQICRVWGGPDLPENLGLTPLSGSLALAGTGLPWAGGQAQSRLHLKPFQYKKTQVAETEVNVELKGPARQQVQVRVQGNFGDLKAQISGRILPLPRATAGLEGEILVEVNHLNPALLPVDKLAVGNLAASFRGRFQAPGNLGWTGAVLDGVLQAKGELKHQTFQELLIQGVWQKETLKLTEARFVMGGLRLQGRGSVSGPATDLQLTLDLSPYEPWPFLPISLRGQTSLQGSIKGPLLAPVFKISGQGQNLNWRRYYLQNYQLAIEGTWSAGNIVLAHLDINGKDLKIPLASFSQVRLTGKSQQEVFAFDLQLNKAQGKVDHVGGTIELKGKPSRLWFKTLRLSLGRDQLSNTGPIQMTFHPGGVEISPSTLRLGESTITLGGSAYPGNLSLQLGVENFPAEVLADFWTTALPLQGPLDLKMSVGGSMASPEIRGHLTLRPGKIANYRFEQWRGNWSYQAGRLRFDSTLEEKSGGVKLIADGDIPVQLSLHPWLFQPGNQGLQINLSSEHLDLAILPPLTKYITAAAGPVALKIRVNGSLLQPLVSGSCRWGAGSVTAREAGVPYSLEPGELRLEAEKIILPQLSLLSGGGKAILNGLVKLSGLTPQLVGARLNLHDFMALKQSGSRGVVNGQASLEGEWPHLKLVSHLLVNNAQFHTTFFRSEQNKELTVLPRNCSPPSTENSTAKALETTFWKNLAIDAVLDVPGGVWVRDKAMKVEVRGRITAQKKPSHPVFLGGKLVAVEGTYTIRDKAFKLDKASLTFPGSPDGKMLLEARAFHQMDDITLFVVVAGSFDNLRTHLESQPPLPQRDLLSYLLFDRPASSLTRDEYLSASQKAVGILGGLTAQKLKDILGGQLPLIGDVATTGGKDSVGVGKKLTKDITVSYERKLNPLRTEDLNQVRIDYKINRYLSVESQVGRRNSGGDVFLNLDF